MCWLRFACSIELAMSWKICPSEQITIFPDGFMEHVIGKGKLNESTYTLPIQCFPSELTDVHEAP